ncbi:hypothetical protein BH11PAT2_BH11PAT2_04740 [soil metagenome]
MKAVRLITEVQDFLNNKVHIRTTMKVAPNGKVYIVLRDKKRGQTLTALVNEVVKPEISSTEPIF